MKSTKFDTFQIGTDWYQIDLDDAQAQLHRMQVDPPAPPGPMQVDDEEEPQEIQGVSEMDFEDQAP